MTGSILRGIGSFYTVLSDEDGQEYTLRAQKKLRHQKMTPMVGDRVCFTPGQGGEDGWLEEILPRKSMMERPSVANVDMLMLVVASVPQPDMLLCDKLILRAEKGGMIPAICVNKIDLGDELAEQIRREYVGTQLRVFSVSAREGTGVSQLRDAMRGKVTCLAGQSAVGKSSLLNALVGYDRAIVTDLPGTTRDTVEEKAVVGGVLLRLIDTAGIRETDDAVERLGVERSRRAVESADLVIVVADGSHTPLTVEPDILALAARAPHWILAISKDDRNPAVKTAVWRLPDGAPAPEHLVSFNSVMPGGLDALIDTIGDCFPAGVPAGGTLLTNARQAEAIRRALESVRAAHEALTAGLTPDVVLTEAEGALDALGELTGRTAREDMVTRIFERFCVGK